MNLPADVAAALDAAADDHTAARAELDTLVRIPSISADTAHVRDVDACAGTVADMMRASGLEEVRELRVGGGHPYVVGEWCHAPDAPTVLLYAHHDVQPAGYVERWSSDPFEATSGATVVSSAAVPPTTRRGYGGAPRRGARLVAHRG
ncbi:MAG: hypothetical protein U0W40_19890 [Acidimicrobiia bacterium]